MTENKLIKFNNKPREDIKGTKILTPVVLSDSKGNWLKQQISHPSESELKWWCKCSSKSGDSLRWLRRNIKNKIQHLGNISLYVWLGTCDLTTKNNKYISLTSFNDKIIDSVVDNFKEIIEPFREYPQSKVTIIELPIYSIQTWNQKHRHKDPTKFSEQDEFLSNQVYKINSEIRKLNKELNSHSPEFSSDLSCSSNYKKGDNRTTARRKYYNFELYADGVHPKQNLASAWLKKISVQAMRDCWKIQHTRPKIRSEVHVPTKTRRSRRPVSKHGLSKLN